MWELRGIYHCVHCEQHFGGCVLEIAINWILNKKGIIWGGRDNVVEAVQWGVLTEMKRKKFVYRVSNRCDIISSVWIRREFFMP